MSNILMVVTAADELVLADGSIHSTGFWAEELVVAHRALTAAGHDVAVATPGGRPAPADPGSLDPGSLGDAALAAELRDYLDSIADALAHPLVLAEQDARGFAAVVLPGGHGPMADLAFDADLGRLLVAADALGAVIAPFCHGPAGLLPAIDDEGRFVFADRLLTVFSDLEERTGGLGANTPWWVEDRLLELGAIVESAKPWSSHVVSDGNLISGQNPQSSAAVAEALLDALGESEETAHARVPVAWDEEE